MLLILTVVLVLALGAVGGGVIASMAGDSGSTAGGTTTTPVEASTTAPSPEVTSDQTPDVTTAPEVTDSPAGLASQPPPLDDPLGLGQEVANQGCTRKWLTMVASTGTPADYTSTLLPRMSIPGAHYLRTDQSCASFNQGVVGQAIYAVYLGPFDSMDEACSARSTSSVEDAYVRQLDAAVPSRNLCSCLVPGTELPTLDSSNASEPSVETQYLVTDIQVMLVRAGFNPGNAIGGHYLELTMSMVTGFQASVGLPATGTTDADTWDALQAYCQPV